MTRALFGFGDGPLARQQRRALTAAPRRVRAIAFEKFSAEQYAPEAVALARDQYGALALGERSAIGLFARIAAALDANDAPSEFVLAATAASHDEARHARYCEELAVRCGFDPTSSVERAAPEPEPRTRLELDVALVRSVAVSETLAAALLMACRRVATDPVVRALLTTLIGDEIHHARLGWYYAAARQASWSVAERQQIADAVAEAIVQIEYEFGQGRDTTHECYQSAHALGILDTERQRACIRDVVEHELLPGLDALGLGASAAWANRRRLE
ncbi:MAG TPA: ferritin-like domain-containing protein [Polyangiaceae bacterium]|nr:ferritin-like domain-containing protein [Polyangiaceae bacterium]